MRISFLLLIFLCVTFSFAEATNSKLMTNETVTILVDWKKASGFGSNQSAVWIEDENGKHIKTLYVSRFTGKGGFIKRPDALSEWRKKAGVDEKSLKELDGITGATPKKGENRFVWDFTNQNGEKVPQAIYYYKVEANLYFAERVIWTGIIDPMKIGEISQAIPEYIPADSDKKERTVVDVIMKWSYQSGKH